MELGTSPPDFVVVSPSSTPPNPSYLDGSSLFNTISSRSGSSSNSGATGSIAGGAADDAEFGAGAAVVSQDQLRRARAHSDAQLFPFLPGECVLQHVQGVIHLAPAHQALVWLSQSARRSVKRDAGSHLPKSVSPRDSLASTAQSSTETTFSSLSSSSNSSSTEASGNRRINRQPPAVPVVAEPPPNSVHVTRGQLFVTNCRLVFLSTATHVSMEYGCVEQVLATGAADLDPDTPVGSNLSGSSAAVENGGRDSHEQGINHGHRQENQHEAGQNSNNLNSTSNGVGSAALPPGLQSSSSAEAEPAEQSTPLFVSKDELRSDQWPLLRVDGRPDAGGQDFSLQFAFVPGLASRRRSDVLQLVHSLCFPKSLAGVFAFVHKPNYHPLLNGGHIDGALAAAAPAAAAASQTLLPGASVYDPVAEFARMGIVNDSTSEDSCPQCINSQSFKQEGAPVTTAPSPAAQNDQPLLGSPRGAESLEPVAHSHQGADGHAPIPKSTSLPEIFVADSDDDQTAADLCAVSGGSGSATNTPADSAAAAPAAGTLRRWWDRTLDFIGVADDATVGLSSSAGPGAPAHSPHHQQGSAVLPQAPPSGDAELILRHAHDRLMPCGRCSGWRLSHANRRFELAPSGDSTLVVPAVIDDAQLARVSAFRDKQRLPVLSWRDSRTGAALCKGAQPRTGMSRQRSGADEHLLQAMRLAAGRRDAVLHIVDARPMVNALAQMAMGAGYENLAYYPRCELEFLGIGNIHAARTARQRLRALCHRETEARRGTGATSWGTALDSTNWLTHLRAILSGADRVAELLAHGRSVFCHCSDGWDRTPQLVSLAQLLLDPYYRTALGFCVLVEKEWVCGGHKFSQRLGHCDPNTAAPDRSPVWLQFLECVWNLIQQHPTAFEFTPALLKALAQCSHSLLFGTFLGNNARDRARLGTADRTPSVWTYLFSAECAADHGDWRNPVYNGTVSSNSGGGGGGTTTRMHATVAAAAAYPQQHPMRHRLLVDTSSRCVRLWEEFHLTGRRQQPWAAPFPYGHSALPPPTNDDRSDSAASVTARSPTALVAGGIAPMEPGDSPLLLHTVRQLSNQLKQCNAELNRLRQLASTVEQFQ